LKRIWARDFRDEFSRFRPEALIDCIGYTLADRSKIVETFEGVLERLVFLSSCDVYRALRLPYNFAQDWSIDASLIRKTTGFSDPFTLKDSL
jgi:hypothetical protein